MQKSLFLTFFILLSASLRAQQTENQGYPVTVSAASFEKIVGTRNGNILMLEEERDLYGITEYDTISLTKKASYPIQAEKETGVSKYLAGVFLVDNKIKVIYRHYVILTKAHTFNVYDCDAEGLIISSKKEFTITGWDKGDFTFFTSNVNKDCLLFGRASKSLNGKEFTFESFLINSNSELLQELRLTEQIEKKGDFLQSSIAINNQHEIFTYGFRNNFDKNDKKFHAQVVLKMYNSSKQEPASTSSFEIPAGYSCAQLMLKEVGDHSVLTGIYQNHNKKKVNGFVGLFRARVDHGKFGTPIFTKYSEATRLKTINGAEITEGVSVRPLYVLHDCLVDSKGNTYVIQERQTINSEGKFYYGSILISKFSANGELLWDNLVPKSQFFTLKVVSNPAFYLLPPALTVVAYYAITRTDEGYLSFNAKLVNDELQLLFNDIKENETKQGFSERQPYVKPEKGVPYVINVKDDGNFTYKCREDLKPSGEPFVLQNAYYINGSYILVSKDKKRGNLLSKVKF